ncbi:MAG: helicase, partial [Christensenella sp.]
VITGLTEDIERLQQNQSEEFPGMMIEGVLLKEKAAAGAAILELCKSSKDSAEKEIGSYKGFAMLLSFDTFNRRFNLTLKGVTSNVVELGADVHGNITRIENVLDGLSQRLEVQAEKLNELVRQIDAEIGRPFEQEAELMEKSERLAAVTALLNLDDRTPDVIDTVPEDSAGQEKTQEPAR